MKTQVLDSWPILEWMKAGESATAAVDSLLSDAAGGKIRLLMSAMNAGEVYYFLKKIPDAMAAEAWKQASRTLPMTIDVPSADDIWSAASLKSRFAISYADAFAAALAIRYDCPLITGDPEFRSVKGLELTWIGRL